MFSFFEQRAAVLPQSKPSEHFDNTASPWIYLSISDRDCHGNAKFASAHHLGLSLGSAPTDTQQKCHPELVTHKHGRRSFL
jgi:hypothetical protein